MRIKNISSYLLLRLIICGSIHGTAIFAQDTSSAPTTKESLTEDFYPHTLNLANDQNCLLSELPPTVPNPEISDGTYYGVVNIPNINSSLFARLDITGTSWIKEQWVSRAILRMSLGHWQSTEFMTIYIPKLAMNPVNGSFVVENLPENLLILSDFGVKDSLIAGTIKYLGQELGQLKILFKQNLQKGDEDQARALATFALLDDAEGSYTGSCEENGISKMHLHLSRWPISLKGNGTFAELYKIDGELSYESANASSKIKRQIRNSSWDPLTGRLNLVFMDGKNEACTMESSQITCHQCNFQKNRSVKQYAMPSDIEKPVPVIPGKENRNICTASQTLTGQYFGYLYHRDRGIWQISRIFFEENNKVLQDETPGLSGLVANFFLGNPQKGLHLVQKIRGRPASNPADLVFEDADSDFFFTITQANDDLIWGKWYAKSFGFIGDVLYSKDHLWVPKSLAVDNFLGSFKGALKLPAGVLQLDPAAVLSEGLGNSVALTLWGTLNGEQNKEIMTSKKGYYDFLTGDFMLRGPKNEKIIYGRVHPNQRGEVMMLGFNKEDNQYPDPQRIAFDLIASRKPSSKVKLKK